MPGLAVVLPSSFAGHVGGGTEGGNRRERDVAAAEDCGSRSDCVADGSVVAGGALDEDGSVALSPPVDLEPAGVDDDVGVDGRLRSSMYSMSRRSVT